MDWNTLIMTLLGGTTFASIYAAIKYRKQNKTLKDNEVKKDDAETQEKQINLAELYKDKVLELLKLIEQVSKKQDSGNHNQTRILQTMDILCERMDKMENSVGGIVTYLNGDFQKFLERQHAPKRGRPRKTAQQDEIHAAQ